MFYRVMFHIEKGCDLFVAPQLIRHQLAAFCDVVTEVRHERYSLHVLHHIRIEFPLSLQRPKHNRFSLGSPPPLPLPPPTYRRFIGFDVSEERKSVVFH